MSEYGTDPDDVARGLGDIFDAERNAEREKRVSVGVEAHRAGERVAAATARQKEVVSAAKKRYDDAVAAAKRELDEVTRSAAAEVKNAAAEHVRTWRAALAAGWKVADLRRAGIVKPSSVSGDGDDVPARSRGRRSRSGETPAA